MSAGDCPRCNGSGVYNYVGMGWDVTMTCSRCHGDGKLNYDSPLTRLLRWLGFRA
jgi:DnaJ-class molecular chaperone